MSEAAVTQDEASTSKDPANLRANAVAKLKRAASLPRMKDGRRPAMHSDGASEGEKSGMATPAEADLRRELPATTEPPPALNARAPDQEPPPLTIPSPPPERGPSTEPDVDMEPDVDVEGESQTDQARSSAKRRSRSRSRSRGSKDLRKLKPLISTSPVQTPSSSSQTPRSEESSQDEGPSSLPAFDHYTPISPASPFLRLYGQNPFQPFMASPTRVGPFSPVSPPSLEDLQRRHLAGLNRSNSAAARLVALKKLTGEPELYDPVILPPNVGTSNAELVRSNTVSGGERGERSIARRALFQKLNRGRNADGEQTSGGEDLALSTTKKQRRRSRRRSIPTNIVDDRDPPSTTTNTPVVAETPLPLNLSIPVPPIPPPERQASPSPSHASSQTASVRRRSMERNTTLAKLIGEDQFEYEPPTKVAVSLSQPSSERRLVVEEMDDELEREVDNSKRSETPIARRSERGDSPFPYTGRGTPPKQATPELRLPHSSEAPSMMSTDSSNSNGLPLFLSDSGPQPPFQRDLFPLSPFNTPLKERPSTEDEEEREEVVYHQDEHRTKRAAAPEPVVSWVDAEAETRIPIDDATDEEDGRDLASPDEVAPKEEMIETDISAAEVTPSSARGSPSLLYGPEMPVTDPIESPASNLFSQSTSTTVTTGNEADESSSSDFASPYLQNDLPSVTFEGSNPTYDLTEWEHLQNQFDLNIKPSQEDGGYSSATSSRWDTVKKSTYWEDSLKSSKRYRKHG